MSGARVDRETRLDPFALRLSRVLVSPTPFLRASSSGVELQRRNEDHRPSRHSLRVPVYSKSRHGALLSLSVFTCVAYLRQDPRAERGVHTPERETVGSLHAPRTYE